MPCPYPLTLAFQPAYSLAQYLLYYIPRVERKKGGFLYVDG